MLMRKDLGFCLAEAPRNGALLPQTALVEQFYARLQARGAGRQDCTSLIQLFTPTGKRNPAYAWSGR